jgi:hypothetical protein
MAKKPGEKISALESFADGTTGFLLSGIVVA